MNQTGHIKETTEDENGFLQFVINCLGENDQRKYFSISPFGITFNIPEDKRVLTADSRNKDENFLIGVINNIKPNDLNKGESAIFSTTEDGSELKSFVKIRNDGTMELNGNSDNLTGFKKNKEGFDEIKTDYNEHKHQIPAGSVIVSVSGGSGSPAVGVLNPTPIDLTITDKVTTASIDDSKKINLKCE